MALIATTSLSGMAVLANLASFSQTVLNVTVEAGFVVIFAGMLMCVYRLLRGPHISDRVLAVDTLAIQLIGLVILLSIRMDTLMFVDGILVLSLLGFAGTVAMAQYIARKHMHKLHPRTERTDMETRRP